MRLARTASPLRRKQVGGAGKGGPGLWSASQASALSARLESNQRSPAPKAGGVARLPYRQQSNDEVGGGPCFPQTGRRVASASRRHPLLVGTPASHRRGPPERCPLPLATPDARYGPRTALASAVVPSLPWTARRQSNAQSTPGGTRTRSFRIESPASFRFDHRGVRQAPMAGIEPALRD